MYPCSVLQPVKTVHSPSLWSYPVGDVLPARGYLLRTTSLLIACPPSHNKSLVKPGEKNGPKYAGNIEPTNRGDGSVSRLLYCGRGWRRRRSWIQAALAFSDSILACR